MSVRRSTNTENLVRGADTLLHQGTMLAKAALWAISSGVLVGSVVVSIGASLVTTGTERTFAYKHIVAKTKVFFSQEKHLVDLVINGKEVSLPADQAAIVTSGIFEKVRARVALVGLFGLMVGGATSGALVLYWRRRGSKQAEDEFIRGTRLVEGQQLAGLIQADNKESKITIAGVPTLAGGEMLHTMISGQSEPVNPFRFSNSG